MKVKFSVIGIPEMPQVQEITLHGDTTARKLVEIAIDKKRHAKVSDHYSLLINGRNVLSLPDKMQTKLKDGDEVILTARVMGG
jgi:molybdopterin converting factor small subunit